MSTLVLRARKAGKVNESLKSGSGVWVDDKLCLCLVFPSMSLGLELSSEVSKTLDLKRGVLTRGKPSRATPRVRPFERATLPYCARIGPLFRYLGCFVATIEGVWCSIICPFYHNILSKYEGFRGRTRGLGFLSHKKKHQMWVSLGWCRIF